MSDQRKDTTLTRLAVIENRLTYIAQRCDDTYKEVTSHFVPLESYQVLENDVKLLKNVVFGFISIIMIGVVGALLSLVLIKQ